jgi:predicted DNA-binding transcriptional regulator YafY
MPTLNKAHRLLYIYHLLNSTESISYEDVEEFNIGKRTFERDLETLREILITEKTTFNKYQNRYELKYVS